MTEPVALPDMATLAVSGVYFLWLNGAVVYVGQAKSVRRRVGEHISEGSKHFDAISIVRCPPSHLDRVERQYIGQLAPKYNACSLAARTREIARLGTGLAPEDCDRHMTAAGAATYLGLTLPLFLSLADRGTPVRSRRLPRSKARRYMASDLRSWAAENAELLSRLR